MLQTIGSNGIVIRHLRKFAKADRVNLQTDTSIAFLIFAGYELDSIDRMQRNNGCFSKLLLRRGSRFVQLNEKRISTEHKLLLRILEMFFEKVQKGGFLAY